MNDAVSTQIVIGMVMSYLLQWLKRAPWFPVLSEQASKLVKIVFSAVVAAGSAFLISFSWDPTLGQLTVTGLTLAHLWSGLMTFLTSFLTQHAAYKLLIKTPNTLTEETNVLAAKSDKILQNLGAVKLPLRSAGVLLLAAALGLGVAATPGCAFTAKQPTVTQQQQKMNDLYTAAARLEDAGNTVRAALVIEKRGVTVGLVPPATDIAIRATCDKMATAVRLAIDRLKDLNATDAARREAMNEAITYLEQLIGAPGQSQTGVVIKIPDEGTRVAVVVILEVVRTTFSAVLALV